MVLKVSQPNCHGRKFLPIINRKANAVVPLPLRPELLASPSGRTFASSIEADLFIPSKDPPATIDIAICGGGVIGSAIACQLRREPSLRHNFVILDAGRTLCGDFFDLLRRLDQRVLRSPYEHQIAPDCDLQLLDYARLFREELTQLERQQVELALSGQRSVVPTDLFIAHTKHVIGCHRLTESAYQFCVQQIEAIDEGWQLSDKRGRSVQARCVILACGSTPCDFPPELASAFAAAPDRVFSGYERALEPQAGEHLGIVGSGLTAGQLVLNAALAGARPTWFLRSEDRYQNTDFDTAWFRTEGAAQLQKLPHAQRRGEIEKLMHGSLMLEYLPLLEEMECDGRLKIVRGDDIVRVTTSTNHITIQTRSQFTSDYDRICVVHGWKPRTELIPQECPRVGDFPLVDDESLELIRCTNLFAAGPLASLAVGPASRVIDGGRLAADRILPVLTQRLSGKPSQRSRITGTMAISAGCENSHG
jgi:hypothetical protein